MPLHPEDLCMIRMPGRPAIHPIDHSRLAISVTKMDVDQDRYNSELFVMRIDGSAQDRAQAVGGKSAPGHSPKWSPTGAQLAFLHKDNGVDELWVCAEDLEERRCLVHSVGVKNFTWSPDGKSIAFVARAQDSDEVYRRIRRLRYKLDGEGYTNGYTHVFLVDVTTGLVTQVSKTRADHGCVAFHPSSRQLAFVSDFADGDDRAKDPHLQLYDVQTGSTEVHALGVKSVTELTFADDGTLYGVGKHQSEANVECDKLFQLADPNHLTWTKGLDAVLGYHVISDMKRPGLNPVLQISSQSRILAVATKHGRQALYCVDMANEETYPLEIEQNILSFSPISSSETGCRVAVIADAFDRPAELFVVDWTYGQRANIQQVSSFNQGVIHQLPKLSISERWWSNPEAMRIHGWVLKADHIEEESRGTILVIHGGPHMAFGSSFHFDFTFLCSLGYQVVICNPRGSYGYGQPFSSAIVGEWGRGDVVDILGFLDHVQATEDGSNYRSVVMGGSYGGYLVNWLISHNHRFSGAISERSICNLYSKIGNSDLGFITNRVELGGIDLWEDEDAILERSPIRHVHNVRTPLLLLHGEGDHRCPIEQSEQWFNALSRMDKDVEYIRFPGASHGMTSGGRPTQRAARLEIIADWLARHDGDEPS